MKNFLFGAPPNSKVTDIGLLLVRLVTGLALALGHGLGKVPPSEEFVEGVGALGFPWPPLFAWAAGLSELVGGFLLAIGLLTRPSSLFIGFTMATALFIRHGADPFRIKEKALLYLVIAVLFVLSGPGRYALDHLIQRRS